MAHAKVKGGGTECEVVPTEAGSPNGLRFVTLMGVLQQLIERDGLPHKVAARLVLARLDASPAVPLYRIVDRGEYPRRIDDSDAFGTDAMAAPKFDVRRYEDHTVRTERATGDTYYLYHADALERSGRVPTVQELEERPELRGQAGALLMMQREGLSRFIAVEAAHAAQLLDLQEQGDGSQEPAAAESSGRAGTARRWTDESRTKLVEEHRALALQPKATPTKTLAARYGVSTTVIRQQKALGEKLIAASTAPTGPNSVFQMGRAVNAARSRKARS